MIEALIEDLLKAYTQRNADLFQTLGISPEEACVRLIWDVPIDPDVIHIPSVIERVCNA